MPECSPGVMFGGPYNTVQNFLKYIGMDLENQKSPNLLLLFFWNLSLYLLTVSSGAYLFSTKFTAPGIKRTISLDKLVSPNSSFLTVVLYRLNLSKIVFLK